MEGFRPQPNKSEKPKSHVSESELIRQAWEDEDNKPELPVAESIVESEPPLARPEPQPPEQESVEKTKKEPEEAVLEKKEQEDPLKEKTKAARESVYRLRKLFQEIFDDNYHPPGMSDTITKVDGDAFYHVPGYDTGGSYKHRLSLMCEALNTQFSVKERQQIPNSYKGRVLGVLSEISQNTKDLRGALVQSNDEKGRGAVPALDSFIQTVENVATSFSSR